jgi:hypothetical protein
MKKFLEGKLGTALKIILALVVILIVFDVRVSWQVSMPDDKDTVCSLKTGKGYAVANGFTGVFLRRLPSLDAECERFKK